MAHPVFDSAAYPWHLEEAQNFHRELYAAVTVGQRVVVLYSGCGAGLRPLAPAAVDVMWKDALDALAAALLLRKLGQLLLAEAAPKVHAAFKAMSDLPDPINEPGLATDTIFVDRQNLRDELGRLGQSNASVMVLLVRGDPRSGKSWSSVVVKEQASSLGHECAYLCDGLVGTVEEAIDLILSSLFPGLGARPPEKLTTDDAWFRDVCNQMIGHAARLNRKGWIVADDLGVTADGPKLDPRIRQFLDQVALTMLNPAFAKWFRLVLIDYPPGPLPTKWKKGFWREDRPTETDVQAPEVAHFLARWMTRKKNKVLAQEDADKLGRDVIAKADAPQPADLRPRLERIHDEIEAVLTKL